MLETLLILIIFGGVIFWSLRRGRGRGDGFEPPKTAPSDQRTYDAYEKAPSLFVNRSELAFYHALRRALPHGYSLHSKTRLEDIARVKPYIKGEGRWKLRARVKSRHVDFLIIDDEGAPHIAIEVDGSSHNKDTQNADNLKDGIFEAINLPLIRVRTGENFAQAAQEIIKGLS